MTIGAIPGYGPAPTSGALAEFAELRRCLRAESCSTTASSFILDPSTLFVSPAVLQQDVQVPGGLPQLSPPAVECVVLPRAHPLYCEHDDSLNKLASPQASPPTAQTEALPPHTPWWLEFTEPRHMKALGSLVQRWHSTGRPVVADLFIEVETERRRAVNASWDSSNSLLLGTLPWEPGEVIRITSGLFEKQGLPAPKLPRQVWDDLWTLHMREANKSGDIQHVIDFARLFCEELLALAATPTHDPSEVDHIGDRQLDLQELDDSSRYMLERSLHSRRAPLPVCTAPVADPYWQNQISRFATPTRETPFAAVPGSVTPKFPRRVLLTSSGLSVPIFRESFCALLAARRPAGDPKILYIPDAAVGNGCDAVLAHQRASSQLFAMGVSNVQCLELRTATRETLSRSLEGVDCVYVDSGNTYYLRYFMMTSGFDQLVPPLVRNHGVVYVGISAGSICAGQTIGIAFWKGWDDPGHGKEWDLQQYGYVGLDLLPAGKSVFPHYSGKWCELVEKRRRELDHEVVALDEEHAYVVCGESEEMVATTTGKLSIVRLHSAAVVIVTLTKPLGILLGDRAGGGCEVSLLQEGGAARASGLVKKGDRVAAVGGQDVRTMSVEQVLPIIAAAPKEINLLLYPSRPRFCPSAFDWSAGGC